MIGEFLSSWSLFADAYLAGWLLAALLGGVGVLVVARDQIFLGAAVSQASMLGLTVGISLSSWAFVTSSSWYQVDAFTSLCGGIFAIAGALATARRSAGGEDSHEAVTGWIFAAGMSLSVLVVAHSPHGLEEVHRLMESTLIGAHRLDVLLLSAFVAISAAVLLLRWRTLVLVVLDPDLARVLGVRVDWWDRCFYIWLGVAIAFALRISGLIYTFGCLVLPALCAKAVCREVRTMLALAPALSAASAVVAFVLANHYDLPPAHVAVAQLVALVGLAWSWRAVRSAVS